MRRLFVFLSTFVCAPAIAPAWGYDDLILPKVDFTATAIQEAGAVRTREPLHSSDGKLRIDRANGFSSTILALTTQPQCLLMFNPTSLITPMDDELFRRYIARTADM